MLSPCFAGKGKSIPTPTGWPRMILAVTPKEDYNILKIDTNTKGVIEMLKLEPIKQELPSMIAKLKEAGESL